VILVFDIGNTETTVGVFEGDALRAHWRLTTAVDRTPDELGLLLHELLRAGNLERSAVTGAAIGSVVPAVTAPLAEACERWLGVTPRVIDARAGLPIVLQVDEPLTVGADRILNTLAASRIYKVDTVVVDLGTATTYDCITAEGVFFGGIIAPGLRTSADTLIRRTSKLPATELVPPAHAIGTRTEECIRAGVLFGAADAIDGLVRRIKAEWPTKRVPKIVATGGLAPLVTPICREIDIVEPHLTLYGLQIAFAFLEQSATA
jgi:type III pantothenate kinase